MASRRHSGTKLLQDEENSLGDGNTIAAWEGTGMPVWFERRLQGADLQTDDGIAITIRRDFSARPLAGRLLPSPSATGHRRRKRINTRHMIVETTRCTQENARMR